MDSKGIHKALNHLFSYKFLFGLIIPICLTPSKGDVQGLPGRRAKVAGEMRKGAKIKSNPNPRPKSGVWQQNEIRFFDHPTPLPLIHTDS